MIFLKPLVFIGVIKLSDPIHIKNIQPGDYVKLRHIPGCKMRVAEVDKLTEYLTVRWAKGLGSEKIAGSFHISEVVWFWATDRFI